VIIVVQLFHVILCSSDRGSGNSATGLLDVKFVCWWRFVYGVVVMAMVYWGV